jgi:hypothetical protein
MALFIFQAKSKRSSYERYVWYNGIQDCFFVVTPFLISRLSIYKYIYLVLLARFYFLMCIDRERYILFKSFKNPIICHEKDVSLEILYQCNGTFQHLENVSLECFSSFSFFILAGSYHQGSIYLFLHYRVGVRVRFFSSCCYGFNVYGFSMLALVKVVTESIHHFFIIPWVHFMYFILIWPSRMCWHGLRCIISFLSKICYYGWQFFLLLVADIIVEKHLPTLINYDIWSI